MFDYLYLMKFCIHFSTVFYPASAVVDSVKKAQQEKSVAILSRALQMCKDKLVNLYSLT